MDVVRRRPHAAYLDSHLWLPKHYVAEEQLRGALTFDRGQGKEALQAWDRERHHYRVPRNYIHPSAYKTLPFPVYDTRYRTFPRVAIRSKVVLDARQPNLTVQRDASAALLRTHDGILCLRCGAGKTATAIHSATRLNVPTLILVTDLGLAEQWTEELLAFTDLTEDDIGMIGDGEFTWQKPVALALVQTLAGRAAAGKLPAELTQHFGLVIGDETHVLGAPYFNLAVPPFSGRRWGLSATPNRSDAFDGLLKYTFGQVVYSYLTPELTPTVYFRRLPTTLRLGDPAVAAAVMDRSNHLHLQKLYGYFATHERRLNTLVSEIRGAVAQGRQVLVLSQSREMTEALGRHFPNAGVCHGGVKDRKERLRRIRTGNPVIAIAQLGKQALNKPSLDTLFVCEPFSKRDVLQQIMGRVLRLHSGKKKPVVVFYDDVHIPDVHGICLAIRATLSRWPADQGGAIAFSNVGDATV